MVDMDYVQWKCTGRCRPDQYAAFQEKRREEIAAAMVQELFARIGGKS